jgi:hypothetical protein
MVSHGYWKELQNDSGFEKMDRQKIAAAAELKGDEEAGFCYNFYFNTACLTTILRLRKVI